ncbi:MAG TPA: division/cell wall cluster transcriptional repressor MraZ [Gemmatimonadales bacterium]
MFLGEYQHSLDAKGRVILPVKFRALLAAGCVLTPGQDNCLYVYPRERWEEVSELLIQSRISSSKARSFTRFWFSGSAEEEPDKQGRIHVPENLRTYAHLDREVAVLGVGQRIEIWDRERWAAKKTEGQVEYADLGESGPDLPI